MNVLSRFLACGAALAALLGAAPTEVAAGAHDRCEARLELRLTPDVPNPRDPAFLSALTANPLYRLTWVEGHDQNVVLDLTGPATDYRCEDEIALIGRSAQVLDLKVLPSV